MNQKTLHIILLGAPGCGKGSLSDRLEANYRVHHFSTGDMLRKAVRKETPLGIKAAALIDQGKLVGDDIILGLMREKLERARKKDDGFEMALNIYDGFPRTVSQALALDQLLAETGEQVSAVICMDCPEEVIARRTSNRVVCRNCSFIGSMPHIEEAEDGRMHCPHCGGILYQRKDDRPEVFKSRMEAYYRQTEPLR